MLICDNLWTKKTSVDNKKTSVDKEKKNMKTEEDIKKAVEVMRKGGVILYPTDTVWGIGCDATNAEAVAKVYKIKHRDDS